MSQSSGSIALNDPTLQGTSPHVVLTADDLSPFRVQTVFPAGMVDVGLPSVMGLSTGGQVRLAHPECALYRLPNARQCAGSSAIRIGNGGAFFTKLGRHAANKELFQDRDLVAFNESTIYLRNAARTVEVGSAFSLLGVHAEHWAHFLVQYLPKLVFALPFIEAAGTVVIRSDSDAHVRAIIRACVPAQVKIVQADPLYDCVHFDELLHCSEVAYICDHAEYSSIADIVIPEPTRWALRDTLSALADAVAEGGGVTERRNLYVAFDGQRGPVNASELQAYFEAKDYLVVRPHQLDFHEKVRRFANADRVVGVGSSGMMNMLFSQSPLKALSFMNYERAFDTLLPQLAEQYPALESHLLVGTRVGPQGVNSRYVVNMQALAHAVQRLDF